jgi:hypothetical protein
MAAAAFRSPWWLEAKIDGYAYDPLHLHSLHPHESAHGQIAAHVTRPTDP